VKTLLTLFSLCVCLLSYSQGKFTIYGKVKNNDPDKVFIQYQTIDGLKIDSTTIVNGDFEFSGSINGPTFASIWFTYSKSASFSTDSKRQYTNIFLDSGVINITKEDKSTKVEGSIANDLYTAFIIKLKPILAKSDSLYRIQRKYLETGDSLGLRQIETEVSEVEKELRGANRSEFLRDPSSPIAVYLLNIYTYVGWETDAEDFDTLFSKLPEKSRGTLAGRELEAKLNTFLRTRIGAIATDFIQKDTAGKSVSLSSYRGKFLLIDFWASWCGPCRKENPNYVSAYLKYKRKGFEILGVSLDENRKLWIKAINDDKLTWTHVSDLNSWQNAVAQLYGIRAVPRNFLLDRSGKIIAKDLRGPDLELFLDKVMN
jgi:peroxiredoxin